MFQAIPSDLTIPITLFTVLLLSFGPALIKSGKEMKRRDLFAVGIGMLVILVAGWVFGFSPASQYEENRRAIMEQNIMIKYNEKYHPHYLRKVEFDGHGGKNESGKYFNLTYNDLSVETVMFRFNEEGEPRCYCTLYQY